MDIEYLKNKAKWLRKSVLDLVVSSKKGHIGGALSCADIMVFLYYGGFLKFNKDDPLWKERDRFILSKGHASYVLYPILADVGFIGTEKLQEVGKNGGYLCGHPMMEIDGVETDTGSLGNGCGVGCGMALAAKMDKKNHRVVVLMGDGECYEGVVWETALFAAHHQLSNLIFIIDRNKLCATSSTELCNKLDSLSDKWRAFNWNVYEIDGHSFYDLSDCFDRIRNDHVCKPSVIIANTVKGKGISYMENNSGWHHGVPNDDQRNIAMRELQ
jgi:transketolase